MKRLPILPCVFLTTLLLTASGCLVEEPVAQKKQESKEKKKTTNPKEPEGKKVKIGKNVILQILPGDKRRVLINAEVCRREDQLEQLLCRKLTKEHEAILAADVDARHIHAALLAAKAKPGSPVQFRPYKAASGTKIKVLLRYKDKNGDEVTVPAQKWIRNFQTKKDMAYDWVFAGSKLFPPAEMGQEPYYAANDGDVICVSNFDTAMLDLPVNLSNENAQLVFEANTARIPPLNTPVLVILEPVPEAKK